MGKDPKVEMVKVATLQLDDRFYPRVEKNSHTIARYARDMRDGDVFPPIIVDAKTRIIIDGVTRRGAALSAFGENAEILAELRHYKNEQAMIADVYELNRYHGRPLSGVDLVHFAIKAQREFQMSAKQIAKMMGRPMDRVKEYLRNTIKLPDGTIEVRRPGMPPMKPGQRVTKAQGEVNRKTSGSSQLMQVNIVLLHLREGLMDRENGMLMEKLGELLKELRGFLKKP